MSFRSGQSGTVVRKGQMWQGRYYVDLPGKEERRRASVPLGSVLTLKKPEAKRKLRAILQDMGLNDDTHLERTETWAKMFSSEAGRSSIPSQMTLVLRSPLLPLEYGLPE